MNKLTELCKLAYKYGSDKCPEIGHQYTPFYYEFLKDKRQSIKKVLEMGVGSTRQYKHIANYHLGASLYMWRDFFPNAQIYGGDIVPSSVFEDGRVKTFLCDERNEGDIKRLIEQTGSDIDLVVDDASHHIADQRFLFKTLMPLLKKDVIYIIEDCGRTRSLSKELGEYDCFIPKLIPNDRPSAHDGIIVITNKP
jgi:hypothetical protein